MNFVINVGSINLNSSTTIVNKYLLRDFIFNNDIDILFLQEVCYSNFSFVPSYKPFVNVSEHGSGTAILIRDSFEASQPLLSLDGRISSVVVNGLNFVNVYAFSGSNRKKERENLFTNDLPSHLGKGGITTSVVGGDFNCIVDGSDCLGENKNYSSGLKQLIESFGWKDVAVMLKKKNFTFHRGISESRLDRFYVSKSFTGNIHDFKTIPVPFSDHCGILMKIKVEKNTISPRGRGYWKINSTILMNDLVSQDFSENFDTWKLRNQYTTDKNKWWNDTFKIKCKQFYKTKSWELNSRISAEKSYFYCKLTEWMDKKSRGEDTLLDVKMIKSRLLEIEANRLKHFGNNMHDSNLVQGESMNIFQISAQIKRMDMNKNLKLTKENLIIVDTVELKKIVHDYYAERFNPDQNSENLLDREDPINSLTNRLDDNDRENLTRPITLIELERVLKVCSKKKSPGPDGLTYEFYQKNFDIVKDDLLQIFNSYLSGTFCPSKGFSDGIITLIPKKGSQSKSLDDYRPISLLNCDYKLFMKILAERITDILDKLLSVGQTACIKNKSCIDNLKDLRRVLTKSCENKRFKGCLVSIDLNKAFDRVDHKYLWKIMEKFGFPQSLIDCIKNVYKIASSKVLVNGFLTDEIKIKNSVRQGCPLSMVLFTLYIEPLIREISNNVAGFLIYDKFVKVVVFADDFNIIIRNDEEFDRLLQIFEKFGRFAKIRINFSKSGFVRFNQAKIGPQMIKELDHLKILGITFFKSWYLTVNHNYNTVIDNIKITLKKHNTRNLNLIQKCWILNTFILSKIWYLAQIFPPLNRHIAQVKRTCGMFLWGGHIFKVERNQLYLDYSKGGLQLVDPEAKMKALFLKNIFYNTGSNGNFVEEKYLLDLRTPERLTKNAREWIMEGIHIKETYDYNSTKLLYNYFVNLKGCMPKIEQKIDTNWPVLWENINMNFISTEDRSAMFCFVNDIIANGQKLAAYNIRSNQGTCKRCGALDTKFHRLKECPKAKIVWEWCRFIVRSRYNMRINDLEDILPFMLSKTSQKHKAALWLTARVISFNLRVAEPSLFVFKKEIRELRWNNWKCFVNNFGSQLNIC